ncbi:MAG: hypothetical protein KER_03383 [Kerstersia gyiorum]|uniref:PKD domain-containing protein n=1 Tax=Kerstersia gyiorum TaxID=206506 RepID=UPI0030D413FF
MTLSLRKLMAGLAGASTLLLVACGGDSSDADSGTPVAETPTAVATATPATAPIGTLVTLDGSGSTGPSGATLNYQWHLSTQPEGSTAVLSNATNAKPTFTPDIAGNYIADLTVSTGSASAAARVTVTATTDIPTAIISPANQTVLLGSAVTLDGSASLPPSGVSSSALTYHWTLTEQPDGDTTTTLNGSDSAQASFQADKTGTYKATLIVRHGEKSSTAAEAVVNVNTGNSAPVASSKVLVNGAEVSASQASNGNLTTTGTITRGQTITLDASGSTDANGDTLHYRWSFPAYISNSTASPKPNGSQTTISQADKEVAEFVADSAGKYYIDLLVYDNSVSSTQRLIITVIKPEGAANIAPVAVVGQRNMDQLEIESGAYGTVGAGLSYDLDNDALSYTWTYWNAATPEQKIVGTTGTGGLLNLGNKLENGTYGAELTVSDGELSSSATGSFVIKIAANKAPTPKAAVVTGTVLVGETIDFDGTGSTDANGDELSYRWTLTDRPDGSKAVIQNAGSAQASVVADQPGRYAAYLEVTDSKGARSNASTPAAYVSVFAKSVNNPPVVANFDVGGGSPSDQPLVIKTFTSTDSKERTGFPAGFKATIFDPDLDNPLYYILTATKYPANSSFTTSAAGSARSGSTLNISDPNGNSNFNAFLLSVAGEYEFQLLASDGVAYSDVQTVNFTVANRANYPGVILESGLIKYDGGYDVPGTRVFFPVNSSSTGGYLNTSTQGQGNAVETVRIGNSYGTIYRLTAGDRDYTITDLVATSSNSAIRPEIVGLTNGQRINKGDYADFYLARPVLPDEDTLVSNLNKIGAEKGYASEEYIAERDRMQALYDDYQLTFSFRIAEKDGFTFYVGPAK